LKEDGWNVSLEFWKNASPMHRRILTIVLIFVVIVILSALATLTPMTEQTATKTNNDLNQTVNSLKANDSVLQYIFGNNFMLTMLMFVPFVGPIFGFYVLYNTGVAIEAEAIAQHFPPTLTLFSLFLTPIAWLEFAAYSTAIAGSIWLSARLLQGRGRHELVNTAKFMSVCAVILLVSAIIETALIL
jgi:hypothetical protein